MLSLLTLIFGVAARTMVPEDRQGFFEVYLEYIDWYLLCGAIGLVACVVTYFVKL